MDLNRVIEEQELQNDVRIEYWRLRRKDFRASEAYHYAKVNVVFDVYEDAGLVKLGMEPEIDSLDMFEPDWTIYGRDAEREKKDWYARAERDGIWILMSYVRKSQDDPWDPADSIGGFMGDDWKDVGYDSEARLAALEALDAMWEEDARALAERPTFAAGEGAVMQ